MTNLHVDRLKRAVVRAGDLAWTQSPQPGVERKMLERDGGEVARATSLVRFAPGHQFPEHGHGGGEEFFVLDGIFCDEHGVFPKGTYVRNPIGTRHAPSSPDGCVILVKLMQMTDPNESTLVIDTNAGKWTRGDVADIVHQPLFESRTCMEKVRIERWKPGAASSPLTFPDGAEYFVLEGQLEDDHGTYPEWTWLRLPAKSIHTPRSESGCTLWIKQGHLSA